MKSQVRGDEALFRQVQKLLNFFVLFLPIGIVKIAGISITFFIYLLIVYRFFKYGKKLFRLKSTTDYLIVLFFMVLILSIVFSEPTYRPLVVEKDAVTIVRLIYWMTLALFIKTWIHRFNFFKLSKYFFYGTIFMIVFYYTVNSKLEILTQNSFAFSLVVSAPISLYYIFKKYRFPVVIIFSSMFMFFGLMSGSRAGAILIVVQIVILLLSGGYIKKKTMLFLGTTIFPIILLLSWMNLQEIRVEVANIIKSYNPDTAELILNPEKVNMIDKSWLDRKQMIVKGSIIFKEHPFLGIGFSHYKYYWVDMPIISPYLNKSMYFYNRLSAHNSYIQVLAGAGIFALALLLLIEFIILKKSVKILLEFEMKQEIFIATSFIGMIIYFYVIAAMMGAITWLIFGLGLSLLENNHV